MSERLNILGVQINNISFHQAIEKVKQLGIQHISSYVCFVNVHMTMEAHKNFLFAQQVNKATLVLADGNPVAMTCNLLHGKEQERIAGMDFMPRLLDSINEDEHQSYRVFFYGSTQEVLNALLQTIQKKYKNVIVAGTISPPFRALTAEEQKMHIQEINRSEAHFVFVGLGCPKQEKWMSDNFEKINAVLLGVGGAFVTTAGMQNRAPVWMQKMSLEWFHRLLQEPKRLFKRYLITNTSFLLLLTKAVAKKVLYGRQ